MAKMGVSRACSSIYYVFLSLVIGWADVYKTMYEYNAMSMPFTKSIIYKYIYPPYKQTP